MPLLDRRGASISYTTAGTGPPLPRSLVPGWELRPDL